MAKKDTLSAVAENYGVSASALRFWEKEGLLRFERDKENNYRTPTPSVLADLWEILLLKSLSFSNEQIKNALRAEADDLKALLEGSERSVKKEIARLKKSLDLLERKKRKLALFYELHERDLQLCEKKELLALPYAETTREIAEYLIRREDENASYIRRGQSPVYALVPDEKGFSERTGRAPRSLPCIYGLLQINVADNANNAEDFFRTARKNGMRADAVLGRYLLSAVEKGARYDFFEGFAFCEKA